jgi:hypothetical protein
MDIFWMHFRLKIILISKGTFRLNMRELPSRSLQKRDARAGCPRKLALERTAQVYTLRWRQSLNLRKISRILIVNPCIFLKISEGQL